ncbi:SGNH/GDSL hydrolase family protein [Nocardia crassostreae]|uniref:SGNH/GDSL hydrolase family protein n=1 Tax=Nocardia crassostreae TaxID=53428 RepID=UPI00083468A2|nr:SGNH/GDSL hydrolase family protein [Nocardia crassostreae]
MNARLAIGIAAVVVVLAATVAYIRIGSGAPPPHDATIELRLATGEALQVSFLGDSLDHGLSATTQELGFRPLVTAAWREGGPVEEHKANRIGGTVGEALLGPAFPADQDLFIVELGTNDTPQVDLRTFRDRYRELLDRTVAASPNTALLCLGLWRPIETARSFDTVIADLCGAHGGVFRPLFDLAEYPRMRGPAGLPTFSGTSDDFHPNDLGHRSIADRVLDSVTVHRG